MSQCMTFPTMWHFDMCRLVRAPAASFKALKLQMVFNQYLNNHRILKRQAKALISLRVCAGWSEPLLVTHTKLLEISCTGSNHILFLSLKIDFVQANIADADEMPHYAVFYLGLHCLPKYPFRHPRLPRGKAYNFISPMKGVKRNALPLDKREG